MDEMTPGETFAREIAAQYDLAPHERELVKLAAEALDRALAAGAEMAEHVKATGSVLLSGKAHPASIVARDSARAFELLTRAAALPTEATTTGESVARLRAVRTGT